MALERRESHKHHTHVRCLVLVPEAFVRNKVQQKRAHLVTLGRGPLDTAECASLIQTGKTNSKEDLSVLCRRPLS